jgi:hypothetical protein
VRLISNEGNNHAIQVEEEHDEVKAQLDEGFLLMHIQLPENLRRIQEMLVLEDFLSVPSQQRQIQDKCHPVPVDKEQEGQESVDGGFGDNVCVKAVAEIDGVDVVAFQIAVHDGEKDLQEEIDGVYQHRQQVQPRFSRHSEIFLCSVALFPCYSKLVQRMCDAGSSAQAANGSAEVVVVWWSLRGEAWKTSL